MRGTVLIPTACLVIKNDAGKVLFVLRQNTGWMDGHYALPGGHVEAGESFTQTACREALEEIGITIDPQDLEHIETRQMHYDDADRIAMTFLVRDWKGEPLNAEPESHGEIAWLDPQHLPENVIAFDVERVTGTKQYVETGWTA